MKGIQRGMDEGWLRIPDGLPMLWSSYDYSACKPGVVSEAEAAPAARCRCRCTACLAGTAIPAGLARPILSLASPPHAAPPACRFPQCTAPLLSIIKHADDTDVPVPPFGPVYEPYWVPWEQKMDTAFFKCAAVLTLAHQRRVGWR